MCVSIDLGKKAGKNYDKKQTLKGASQMKN